MNCYTEQVSKKGRTINDLQWAVAHKEGQEKVSWYKNFVVNSATVRVLSHTAWQCGLTRATDSHCDGGEVTTDYVMIISS